MRKIFILAALGFSFLAASGVAAKLESYTLNGKTYYKVSSEDKSMDTGNEVCKKAGLKCAGYTSTTNDVCKNFHPNASSTTSVNGSKSGFYCDGAPQKGLACEKSKNNCQVCPQCNVNADCNTNIGDQFREMYVECSADGKPAPEVVKVSWWNRFTNWFSEFFKRIWVVKKTTVTVKVPGGKLDPRIGNQTGSVVCEFYQMTKPGDFAKSNVKHVTCGAVKAADTYCATVMGSRFAKAVKCEDNGIIVCTNPCKPPESQVKIKSCAFDAARPRGSQAAPIEFCEQTTTVEANPKGTKTPGQVCQHGGECTTGNCIGQPSDNGIKYFCSCNAFRLDYSCKK